MFFFKVSNFEGSFSFTSWVGRLYLNTKYPSQKKSYLLFVLPPPTSQNSRFFHFSLKKDSSKRDSIVAIGPQMNYLCVLIFASIVNLFQSKYFLMDMRRLRSNQKIRSQSNYMKLADSDSSVVFKIVKKRF